MNKLLELRKERNLKQEDLAILLGMTRQGYSYYEKGLRDPDPATLQKLSQYFGVSIDYILGSTEVRTVLPGETPLTDNEKTLLELFNQVPKEQQQLVVDLVAVALKNLK